MPSYLTSAHPSRIRKPDSASSVRRYNTSPFSASHRTKPSIRRAKSLVDAAFQNDDDEDNARLDATGVTSSTLRVATATDVPSAMRHATDSMFCPIPERAGMNSTRIAEVLNFQKNLPPLVSLAHVHGLISASSKTERQINSLIASGDIRKVKVIGRGNDISGVSESLIATSSLERLLKAADIAENVISDYLAVLRHNPRATTLPAGGLLIDHIAVLTRAGFLVSASSSIHQSNLSGSSLVSTASISRAYSGTSGAIGGEAAFENLGGVGAAKRHESEQGPTNAHAHLMLSIPRIGAYIRLLNAGRTHLLDLLNKFSYKEAPLFLLRERWDGAVDGDSSASKAKQLRGVYSDVMPNKTKKWKKLWGLRFDWALEECLGAGLVEVFETGSVGLGVRIVGR